MRLLHLADVHLDRPFVGMEIDAARARRRELRTTFEKCLALARKQDVQVITIGGDLWEDEHRKHPSVSSTSTGATVRLKLRADAAGAHEAPAHWRCLLRCSVDTL